MCHSLERMCASRERTKRKEREKIVTNTNFGGHSAVIAAKIGLKHSEKITEIFKLIHVLTAIAALALETNKCRTMKK